MVVGDVIAVDDEVCSLLLLLLQGYHETNDVFNYNYGQAKAAVGEYKDAIQVLILLLSQSNPVSSFKPEFPLAGPSTRLVETRARQHGPC